MNKQITTIAPFACAGMLVLAGLSQASAQGPSDQSEAAIKYRQSVMSIMGGVMGTAVGQLRDNFEYGPDLQPMADALVAASSDIPALFPQGTDSGDTRALAEVWSKRDEFENDAADLHESAQAFAKAVANGERRETFKAFKAVGDACKSCHEDFREKQN